MPEALFVAAMLTVLPSPADPGEGSATRHISTFPEMAISRAGVPHEWPFAVEAGTLTCVPWGNERVVLFSEPWRTDVPQEFGNMRLPRSVIVSANPFAIFASYEDRSLYLPFDGFETLIKRLAPFEAMGTKLCETDRTVPPEAAP